MAEGDTIVNALLGAVTTVVLAGMLPVSPIAGGMLAGYLEGGDRNTGIRVGAISGGIALIPVFVVAFLLWNVLFFAVAGSTGFPGAAGGLGFAFILFAFVFFAVYVVGLSTLGGWLGNYVKYDTDLG